jgi:hypothetical protein
VIVDRLFVMARQTFVTVDPVSAIAASSSVTAQRSFAMVAITFIT